MERVEKSERVKEQGGSEFKRIKKKRRERE